MTRIANAEGGADVANAALGAASSREVKDANTGAPHGSFALTVMLRLSSLEVAGG